MTRIFATSILFVLASLNAAYAHHPMGGEVPTTIMQGLLSGLGHPVIGFDHLAFIIGVGLLAAFQRNRLAIPVGFAVATMLGTTLTLSAVALPLAELVIAASVVVVGAALARGRLAELLPTTVLVSVAGLFHGWAYGGAVIGAEPTPVLAYLVGIAMVQMAVMLGVGLLARSLWQMAGTSALQSRLAGAMVAGVGLAYLVENLEGVIFPGM